MENQTDIILWKQFREGSSEAFQQIYQSYFKVLYNYGMQVSSDVELIKDCIQDLFVYLWKNKTGLGDTTSIKFYLFTSLRRKIVQEQKKGKKQESDPNVQHQAELVFLLEEELIKDETWQIRKENLIKALNNLPARQKEVLLLLYYHNLGYEEVAQIMEINTRSVYTLAWKAITSLRQDLVQSNPSTFWLLVVLMLCKSLIYN